MRYLCLACLHDIVLMYLAIKVMDFLSGACNSRWPDGGVIHIQLTKHAHQVFCEGVKGVVGACRQRLSWLKKGSRELFGTLLESKIVIVVDTSVSMGKRLSMLKEKLQQLIQVSHPQSIMSNKMQKFSCSKS